ncbi:MAG: PEP-CTERM sorting domain-containing protein [Rhodocyclaceae bacterium]|nr:PEP-CTERM sorting domain-containing protein [Rhodocyclaceae bacterium]
MVGGFKSADGALIGAFTGQIDEVRVYDSALSAGEVARIYASVTAVPEPETYATMLAGLGVLGALARRRRQ